MLSSGLALRFTTAEPIPVGAAIPAGKGAPEPTAVLLTMPVSISACVKVYVPVNSTIPPCGTLEGSPAVTTAVGCVPVPLKAVSLTFTSLSVVTPVFSTL